MNAVSRHRSGPPSTTRPATRTFVGVWIALLALLLLTFGSAYVPLGRFNSAINLTIAVVKALLVLVFFMELRERNATTRAVAALALVGLSILIGLALTDFLAR